MNDTIRAKLSSALLGSSSSSSTSSLTSSDTTRRSNTPTNSGAASTPTASSSTATISAAAAAAAAGADNATTTTTSSSSSSWLLRFFESKHFDMSIAISYLFNTKEPGVQTYLCNRLFTFDNQQVDFYLPQLLNIYVYCCNETSNDQLIADMLNAYFRARCACRQQGIDFSLRCSWLLDAHINDNAKLAASYSGSKESRSIKRGLNNAIKLYKMIIGERLRPQPQQAPTTHSSSSASASASASSTSQDIVNQLKMASTLTHANSPVREESLHEISSEFAAAATATASSSTSSSSFSVKTHRNSAAVSNQYPRNGHPHHLHHHHLHHHHIGHPQQLKPSHNRTRSDTTASGIILNVHNSPLPLTTTTTATVTATTSNGTPLRSTSITNLKLAIGDLMSGRAFDNNCTCHEQTHYNNNNNNNNTGNDYYQKLATTDENKENGAHQHQQQQQHFECVCNAPRLAPEIEFTKALINIGKKLARLATKELKTQRLMSELAILNMNLPARVWLPLYSSTRNHYVVRIPYRAAAVLNSKEKAPFIVYVEVLECDDIYDTPLPPKLLENSVSVHHAPSQAPPPPKSTTIATSSSGNGSQSDLLADEQQQQHPHTDSGASSLSSVQNNTLAMAATTTTAPCKIIATDFFNSDCWSINSDSFLQQATSSNNTNKSNLVLFGLGANTTGGSSLLSAGGANHPAADAISIDSFTSGGPSFGGGGLNATSGALSVDQVSITSTTTAGTTCGVTYVSASEIRRRLEYENTSAASKSSHMGGVRDPDDPSMNALREPWTAKQARIRETSPYGHYPTWRLLPVIIKAGDDLRQELLAFQFLHKLQEIWNSEYVPVYVRPSNILVLSNDSGMIEPILNAVSLHQIKKHNARQCAAAAAAAANSSSNSTNGATNGLAPGTGSTGGGSAATAASASASSSTGGEIKPLSLLDYFLQEFGQSRMSEEFLTAQKNFVESCAGYSIACYLLQVKDRHNGNILLDDQGHLIHIDYGFMLSSSPKNLGFESSAFKMTYEFVEVMGGEESDMFAYFKILMLKGFLSARKHMDKLVPIVEIMQLGSQLPCFQKGGPGIVRSLRDRFHLNLTEEQLQIQIDNMITNSINSLTTRMYDNFQYYTNDIH